MFQQMAADMTKAFRGQTRVPAAHPEEARGLEVGVALREFCKFNPPTFSGEPDPLLAEDWLK